MCLAVPGKILSIAGDEPLARIGRVSFGGLVKQVSLAYVPEACVGDYVIVHVGFAISTLDQAEAHRVFDYLQQMDELRELEMDSSPAESVDNADTRGTTEGFISASSALSVDREGMHRA